MSHRGLKRALRHASKENRLGASASCETCNEIDPRSLQRSCDRILCAECRLEQEGQHRYELHHPAGRHNDGFVIPMHANAHAIMSDYQQDWPVRTLQNPDGDPLRRRAAWWRAIRDLLDHQAQEAEAIAVELEDLAEFLSEEYRPDWSTSYAQWRERRDPQ